MEIVDSRLENLVSRLFILDSNEEVVFTATSCCCDAGEGLVVGEILMPIAGE